MEVRERDSGSEGGGALYASGRCWRTRRLLEHRGYRFEVIDATNNVQVGSRLARFTQRKKMPYVYRPPPGL
jgi:hypothetical protein